MASYHVLRVFPGEDLFNRYLACRYQVYCLERGFEDPGQHSDGREWDPFDEHSIHLAAIDSSDDTVVGTARIILDSPLGFPVESHFPLERSLEEVGRDQIGEISRLAVPKTHCQDFRIISKLLDKIFLVSGKKGITHWCAAMAKGLPVLLQRKKIYFEKIGPEKQFHGIRAPYWGAIDEIASRSDHYIHYAQAAGRCEVITQERALG